MIASAKKGNSSYFDTKDQRFKWQQTNTKESKIQTISGKIFKHGYNKDSQGSSTINDIFPKSNDKTVTKSASLSNL